MKKMRKHSDPDDPMQIYQALGRFYFSIYLAHSTLRIIIIIIIVNQLEAITEHELVFPKVFEEDALQWEEKLNRIHDVFDVWIDVQRRWVYLDGIFSGSADIKALLPVETQRFQR